MIQVFSYISIFIFGLIVGSFLNCLIYRMETSQSFLKGRSFCPYCCHNLGFWDLIPVLSFIFLKGKCRYCKESISWQYPIVEIATGLLFLLIFNFQFPIFNQFSIFNFLTLIYYWTISAFLIVIFVYDLKHYIIPDKVIYPAIAIALIFNFQLSMFNEFLIRFTFDFNQFSIFQFSILSAIAAAGFFLLIVLISKGKWMGVGDIKLAFLMGLMLGFPNILVALFLAFFIGSIIGISLIFLNKKTLKSEIPFGPFLISGFFLALFLGDSIVSWYQGLFLI